MTKPINSQRSGKNRHGQRLTLSKNVSPLLWKGAGMEDWKALRETLVQLLVKTTARY